jgi:HEAT repeat protein
MRCVFWVCLVALLATPWAPAAEDADVVALLLSLKDERAYVRAAAALALGNRRDKAEDAVPALVEALADKEGAVRWRAVDALVQINRRPEAVVPALLRLLESTDAADRTAAAEALGSFAKGGGPVVPALLKVVKDESHLARARAIDALRSLPPPKDVSDGRVALFADALRGDPDRAVRRAAVIALAHTPGQDEAVLAALADGLRAGDEYIRGYAAHGMGGRKNSVRFFGAVEPLLKDTDSWPRLRGADALYQMDAKAGQAAVLKVLKDPKAMVRASAAEALGGFRADTPAVLAALAGATGDGDVTVRFCAVRSLARFGPAAKDVLPSLVRVVQQDQSAIVRASAADALGAIGPDARDAVPALIGVLPKATPAECERATEALAKITKVPAPK